MVVAIETHWEAAGNIGWAGSQQAVKIFKQEGGALQCAVQL
jgi:hypothetical protein